MNCVGRDFGGDGKSVVSKNRPQFFRAPQLHDILPPSSHPSTSFFMLLSSTAHFHRDRQVVTSSSCSLHDPLSPLKRSRCPWRVAACHRQEHFSEERANVLLLLARSLDHGRLPRNRMKLGFVSIVKALSLTSANSDCLVSKSSTSPLWKP